MRWGEIEQSQPRLAELGRRLLIEPGVVLVATIRRDGTPRVSPVEPFVLDGIQRRYADSVRAALGWDPEPGRFHLFVVDVEDVAFIRYDEPTGDQYVAMWPPGAEFVRPGTSATSVGKPHPVRDVLAAR